jgi:hypothetical protein
MMAALACQACLLLLLQAPGDGWAVTDSKPGEIRKLYWDLFDTTEVWVRLSPEVPDGKGPAPLRLVFQAFYPGREPKGPPKRIGARVVGPAVADLSFRLAFDGTTVDLTGPEGNSRLLFPAPTCQDRGANGVDAELKPNVLRAPAAASRTGGTAMGVRFEISAADRKVLQTFVQQLGLPDVTEGP